MISSKKPPYSDTTVDPEKTKGQIAKLLRDYGVQKYNWAEDYQSQKVALTFETEAEIKGVRKRLLIQVEPPTFAKEHRTWNSKLGRNEKIFAPNWAQSYRLLFHWLKAKIEAIAYGLTTVEQEFLAQVVVELPSGERTTFGRIVVDPEQFATMLPAPKDEPPFEDDNVAEASFTEVHPA